MIRIVHYPGTGSRYFYPSRIQGSKRPRIPDPDPEHWKKLWRLWSVLWTWSDLARIKIPGPIFDVIPDPAGSDTLKLAIC
jgi:hypothetical protein